MKIFVLFTFLLLSFICVCFLFRRPKEEYKIMYSRDNSIPPFKLCGCEALRSNHQMQTEHKLRCPIFHRINPGRTRNELLKACGFDNLVREQDSPLSS
jgi:hypothetical protein